MSVFDLRKDEEWQRHRNEVLLKQIMFDHGCQEPGAIGQFHAVSADWACPCCHRKKREIGRRDRNGRLVCSIVEHHDHLGDWVWTKLRPVLADAMPVIAGAWQRFDPTLICQDCNTADTVAKSLVQAPEMFSFSWREINSFIWVQANTKHRVIPGMAAKAYEKARVEARWLAERAVALKNAHLSNQYGEEFQLVERLIETLRDQQERKML